jgi:hypothetical protein
LGAQVIAYADNKLTPTFLIVEGKIQITKEIAAEWFQGNSNTATAESEVSKSLLATREIYFRTVQKGGQLWGSFDFRNSDGKTIEAITTDANGKKLDLSALIKNGALNQNFAGFCANLGSSDLTACRDIDPSKYEKIWVTDSGMPVLSDDFKIDESFSATPSKSGIITK